ncbi:hypothetical protein DFAR_1830005 [Desulfarculales bacterium]
MLINPILNKLPALGLEGMLKALNEQLNTPGGPGTGLREKTRPDGGQRSHPQRKSPAQKQAGQGQAPA